MNERPDSGQEHIQKELQERWLRLWGELGVAESVAAQAFEDIVRRYSEPQRAYHTLEHIDHCLRELEDARAEAGDARAVAMALWYHDAIYEVRAKDNEEKSAALAQRVAHAMRLPEALTQRVVDLILLTKHAKGVGEQAGKDERLLTDIDLAILGQPEGVFDRYDFNIRQEYSWVPEEAYREGRIKVLQSFLERPHIFETEFFRKKYEEQARRNIARAIARLKGSSL